MSPRTCRGQFSSCRQIRLGPVAVALLMALTGCDINFNPAKNEYQPPEPPDVTVATPLVMTVPVFIEENAETEAVNRADVSAQVGGILKDVNFEPGDFVSEGAILYVIDPDDYQAALDAADAAVETANAAVQVAEAQVGVAKAEVDRAELELDRQQQLVDRNAGTKQQLDNARAARDSALAMHQAAIASVESAKADVLKAEASQAQAQLDLDRTEVVAPIEGRVTKTNIKEGNLVATGSLLATVVDRREIYANFNLSDREALRLQKERKKDFETEQGAKRDYKGVRVFLRREIDESFPFDGHLDYVDEEGVDQSTGTLAIRAVFKNEDELVLPGLFARVRLPIDLQENALLIPEQAVSRDQQGEFVLLVDSEKKVVKQGVTSGQSFGGMVVIEDGLSADDSVLTGGAQRVRPGTEVTPKTEDLKAPEIPQIDPDAFATPQNEEDGDSTEADEQNDSSPADADSQ